MRKHLSILFLLIPVKMFSQSGNGQVINDFNILAARNASAPLSYNDVEGSPYYSPVFITSTVFLKNNTYASIPLRYDMYLDEMEFMRNNTIQWLSKREIKYIRYGSEMVFVKPSVSDSANYGYFFFNEDGKNKLVCRKSVKFYPFVLPQGYAEGIPNRFERKNDEFYIQLEGKPAMRMKTRKDLSNLFSNDNQTLDFIKKEKIKVDDFNDLIQLMNYINK